YLLIRTISRYREYAADRGSALITGAPEHLMSALQKIASQISLIPQRDLRQVEGMNAFFIVPTNVKAAAAELFMTHPPLEKRLARRAADRRPRLRMADRPRPRPRGPRHDGAPDRLGARRARLRPAAPRVRVSVRRRQAPRVLDLRLQARRLLAVRADGRGAGARQRDRARAEGEAREGAPDRARPHALVRPVRRSDLATAHGTAAAASVTVPLRWSD